MPVMEEGKPWYPTGGNQAPTRATHPWQSHPTPHTLSPTSPQNIPPQYPPKQNVNFHPDGSSSQRSSATDSRSGGSRPPSAQSGGSWPPSAQSGGSRPPSTQSGGYRLAHGLENHDLEGYLAPRSSAGSYQLPPGGRIIGRDHDSGVDIDAHGDGPSNLRSSGSESSKESIQFHPNGAIGWSNEPPQGNMSHNSPPIKDPVKPGRPDSIAYRGHEYEELPLNKEKYAYADINDNPPGKVRLGTSLPEGSEDDLTGAVSRRRHNPLYDAVTREDSKASSKAASQGCNRCICTSIIALALLSAIALILAIIAMTGAATWRDDPSRTDGMVSTPSYAQLQLQEAMDRIEQLEARYNTLKQQYTSLQALVGDVDNQTSGRSLQEEITHQSEALTNLSRVSETNSQTAAGLEQEVKKLQNETRTDSSSVISQMNQIEMEVIRQNRSIDDLASENERQNHQLSVLEASDLGTILHNVSSQGRQLANLSSQVYRVENDFSAFRTEIRNTADDISKMPGPQGPPGAGNLTQCEMKGFSQGAFNDGNPVRTAWKPSSQDNERYVITGLSCSSDLAEYTILETTATLDFTQYRCSCLGTRDNSLTGNKFCYLYMWRCPRTS